MRCGVEDLPARLDLLATEVEPQFGDAVEAYGRYLRVLVSIQQLLEEAPEALRAWEDPPNGRGS